MAKYQVNAEVGHQYTYRPSNQENTNVTLSGQTVGVHAVIRTVDGVEQVEVSLTNGLSQSASSTKCIVLGTYTAKDFKEMEDEEVR